MDALKTETPVYDDVYYDEFVKFLEKYDDYNLPQSDYIEDIPAPDFDVASQVFITLTIVFGCAAFIILLTAISAKTRTVSVSWYMYSLALETVIQTLVFTPLAHSKSFEVSIYAICRLEDTRKGFGLLRILHIIFINAEVVFTILNPLRLWLSTVVRRFIVVFGATWILAFVFSDMILPSLQDTHCMDGNQAGQVTIHVSLNWLPGLVVLGLTLAAVVFYSKGFFLRIHLETSGHDALRMQQSARMHELRIRARAHEWFIFLIVLNAQFLLLDLVLVELIDGFAVMESHGNMLTYVYLKIIHELLRVALPLTLLSISKVRETIYEANTRPCALFVACRRGEAAQDEEVLTMSGTAEQCV